MKNKLINSLGLLHPLSNAYKTVLETENLHQVQTIDKKGAVLIPGKDANEFHYIASGAFKLFYYDEEGAEVLQYIWVDGDFMVLPEDYAAGSKNKVYHITAMQESVLLTLSKVLMDGLCVKYPEALVHMNRIRTQMRDFTHAHVEMLNLKQRLRYAFYVKYYPAVFRKSLLDRDVMLFLGICQKTLTTSKREMVLRDRGRFR